jgi:hypothetical protein
MAGSQIARTTTVRPMLHRAAFGMNGSYLAAVASADKVTGKRDHAANAAPAMT